MHGIDYSLAITHLLLLGRLTADRMTAGRSHWRSGFLRQAWQASLPYVVNEANCIARSLVCFPECINTFGFKGNIEVNICAAVKYHCGTREILHTLTLAICGLEGLFFFFLFGWLCFRAQTCWVITLEISTSAWSGLTYSPPYTQPWWVFGFLFFCPNNYSASGQISIVGLGSMSPELS